MSLKWNMRAKNVFYTAPEVVTGANRDVTPQTDVYAFGVLMHEVLTRTLASRERNPYQWVDDIKVTTSHKTA